MPLGSLEPLGQRGRPRRTGSGWPLDWTGCSLDWATSVPRHAPRSRRVSRPRLADSETDQGGTSRRWTPESRCQHQRWPRFRNPGTNVSPGNELHPNHPPWHPATAETPVRHGSTAGPATALASTGFPVPATTLPNGRSGPDQFRQRSRSRQRSGSTTGSSTRADPGNELQPRHQHLATSSEPPISIHAEPGTSHRHPGQPGNGTPTQHRRWSRSPSPGNGPALPLPRTPTFPAPVPGKGTLARGMPRPAHRHSTALGEIPGSSTHPERIPTVPILLQNDYYPVPRLDRLAEAVSFANTPERPHWQNVPTAQSE